MGKLFSLGHKIIHIPTLKISAVKTESVDINQYDALIFTSANAIRNLKVVSEEKSKLCFCVGFSLLIFFKFYPQAEKYSGNSFLRWSDVTFVFL